MDTLGQILWFIMFGTPLITVPIAWRIRSLSKLNRILIGFAFASILSLFLYHLSLHIIFRDGMGPG